MSDCLSGKQVSIEYLSSRTSSIIKFGSIDVQDQSTDILNIDTNPQSDNSKMYDISDPKTRISLGTYSILSDPYKNPATTSNKGVIRDNSEGYIINSCQDAKNNLKHNSKSLCRGKL